MALLVEQWMAAAGFWLTLAVTALALWKGGRAEQAAVLANLGAVLLSPLLQPPPDTAPPYWSVAAIDTAVFLLLCLLLIRTGGRRRWLFAASGVQLLTVLVHVGAGLDVSILARGYIAALETPYFVLLICFAAGVAEVWRKGESLPLWRSRGRRRDPDAG